MAYTEEELFDMSDDELDAAVAEERAELDSPDTVIEEEEVINQEVDSEDGLEEPDNSEESAAPEEGDNDDEDNELDDVPADEADNTDEGDDGIETESKIAEPERAEVKVRKFKANGQEFEFTEQEMVEQFGKVFGQSMNYTKKMQAIAPYRKMISAFEDEGLKEDDMNLMIDALKGNKDAIGSLLKRTGVDALDLDTEEEDNSYVPNDYGRNELELQLNEVIDTIKDDQEFSITQNVVSNQWDDKSRDTFASNPDLIRELHIDVQTGTYDKVSPMATKLKVLDGGRKSDIEYYVEAGKQYHTQTRAAELQVREVEAQAIEQTRLEKVQTEANRRAQTKQVSTNRKAATIPKKRVSEPRVTDYLEDTDEAFDDWYDKLQESI